MWYAPVAPLARANPVSAATRLVYLSRFHSVILDMMAVESYRATEATILQRAQQ